MRVADVHSRRDEAEEVFEVEFDRAPPPELGLAAGAGRGDGLPAGLVIDLDGPEPAPLPPVTAHAFTLWLRARDPYARLPRAAELVREHFAENPFSSLQVVLETGEDFAFESIPGDIFQLGNASYRIQKVEVNRVFVEDARGAPPTIPFWFGEAPARSDELSASVSRLREQAMEHLDGGPQACARWLRDDLGLEDSAAGQLGQLLRTEQQHHDDQDDDPFAALWQL